MKKLIAIILLLCILTSIVACSKKNDNSNGDLTDGSQSTGNQPQDAAPTIVVPQYKDYGRGTVNFNEIVYSRPDIQSLVSAFDSTALMITENSKSPTEQTDALRALENPLKNAQTMYTIVEIYQSKDASSGFWKTEYEYMSVNFPKLSQAVENLLVACAKSEHKEMFEEDYFDYNLDEYVSGGIYTDEVVSLMQSEAELEARYSSLSTATVEIVYKRIGTDKVFEGTVDEVKAMLHEYFAGDEQKYKNTLPLINDLYKQRLNELTMPLYTELIKVRRLIADELGYASYSKLAYEVLGYDYSESDMRSLLNAVGLYVSPIAKELEYAVFYNYFLSNPQPVVDRVSLINTLYEAYYGLGGNYRDAFSYMLQHGLYDVSGKNDNRYSGAFSTYLESNSSPYIFVTTKGFIEDYNTLSHEFGHFLDGYINYGEDASLAIMEVSSQALELLTLLKLRNILSTPEYQYLEYFTVFTFIKDVLMTQSFYSVFEHMAYELNYEEINEEKLEEIAVNAFKLIYGDDVERSVKLSDVIIPHTVLYPFYVESYVTSAFVSLDIFFAESEKTGKTGDGFKLYEELISRDDDDLSFAEELENAGIDSPFSDGEVEESASDIYYYIMGKRYKSGIGN